MEYSLEEDQRHILSQIIGIIEQTDADAVVIAGDIYDRSDPSSAAVEMVNWFLEGLVSTGKPILLCAGNHDSQERVAYAGALISRMGVFVSPSFGPASQVGRSPEIRHVTLQFPDGPVTFWLFPFVRPTNVRAAYPDAEVKDYTDALRILVEHCDIDSSTRNVALVHQFVTDGSTEQVRYDSESIGTLDNCDASVFSAFEYVALGHLHGAHAVGSERIRYSGSPLKYSASEALNDKSVTLVTLGGKEGPSLAELEVETIPLEPIRDLRRISGPLSELVAPDVIAEGNPQDYIFCTITDEEPPLDAMAQLRQVYPNLMNLSYDNSHTRAIASGATDGYEAGERKSLVEHFADFFLQQTGEELDDTQTEILVSLLESEVM